MNFIINPKKQAHLLKTFLKEKGFDISLGHAYEAVSIIHGYPNWDTYSAIFKMRENSARIEVMSAEASVQSPMKRPGQISFESDLEAEMARAFGYPLKHPDQIRFEEDMNAEMARAFGYPLKHPDQIRFEEDMNAEMARAFPSDSEMVEAMGYPLKHPDQIRFEEDMNAEMARAFGHSSES